MNKSSKNSDWFWDPVLSQWRGYISILLATFLVNIFALAVPIFTMNVYDYVIPTFSKETLVILTSGVIIALIFDFILKNTRMVVLDKIAMRLEAHYDLNLINHMMSAKIDLSLGEKINVFKDLQAIRDFYATKMATGVVDSPFIILFILVIYLISPAIAIVPIIAVVVIFIVSYFSQIPQYILNQKHLQAVQIKSVMLMELLRGSHVITQNNANNHFLKGWTTSIDESNKTVKASQLWASLTQNFSMLVAQLTTIGVLCVGVYQIEVQAMTIGGLVAVTILSGRIIAPAINISTLLSRFRQTKNLLTTVNHIFATPSVYDERKGFEGVLDPKGTIKLQSVSYGYKADQPSVLNDINLDIIAGQKVALIGPSGSGKSTLLSIIAGQKQPSAGFSSIDGHAYHQVPFDNLNAVIGYVPQNPFIFNSTVKENILMGCEIEEARFKQVLEDSGLAIYMGSPHFYLDKQTGENGCDLADGQIRAIAIARVLVQNPQVILMDEPNNSMDQALEQRFIQTLKTKMTDKTVIVITHKINLLPLMDKVFLLNDGKITHQGQPEEVLNALGYWKGQTHVE